MAKLAGALPKDNGLSAIAGAMVQDPEQIHVVIALVDCSKLTTNTDTAEVEATARIRSIEVMKGPDADQAHAMLRRTAADRTGVQELPLHDAGDR